MKPFDIHKPYLLFLGDAADELATKTARGILDWRPQDCVGQLSLPECRADLNIREMTLEEAYEAGARTLVIGLANRGGKIASSWLPTLRNALEIGYDLANGLHQRLSSIDELAGLASKQKRKLFDVRHADGPHSVGNGEKRAGKRLLPVGTDCSCGKMYTALAFETEMKARGINVDFRATGQTGILVAGAGVSVDAVPADFISGVIEELSPANDPEHWDLIEGQGSLFHPSFAGVSLGLIHGAQPDALVLCHEPTRTHMRGLPEFPIPALRDCLELNANAAKLTNPNAKFVGLCINTSKMQDSDAADYLKALSEEFLLPAVDPYRHGVSEIVDSLVH